MHLGSGTAADADDQERLWCLHLRVADHRCGRSLASLVQQYTPQVHRLARQHFRGREPIEDLDQVAFEALVKAILGFDPGRRIPFLAFGLPSIAGVLKRHYRDVGWAVRVPRWMHEVKSAMNSSVHELTQQLGREPTTTELAAYLGESLERVRTVMRATAARELGSLDAPGSVEVSATTDIGIDLQRAEDRCVLEQALAGLGRDDRRIVDCYYHQELTQSEVADRFGLSQTQISRRLRRISTELRGQMVSA